MSYTTFSYSGISLGQTVYRPDDILEVSFTLSNMGEREGTEVVQVYVRDLVGSITRPVKELKAFERVRLDAGESRSLTVRIPVSDLAFYGLDGVKKVETAKAVVPSTAKHTAKKPATLRTLVG